MRRFALGFVIITASVLASGCANYYRVSDPASGKEYYTTEVKNRSGGAVTFKDAATGDEVTLQNSHVSKVTKEDYETNRAGKQ